MYYIIGYLLISGLLTTWLYLSYSGYKLTQMFAVSLFWGLYLVNLIVHFLLKYLDVEWLIGVMIFGDSEHDDK